MKTTITLIVLLFVFAFTSESQIPNASFENWTAGNPVGWASYNGFYPGLTTEVTDFHAGSKAAQLNVIRSFGSNTPGTVFTGSGISPGGFNISSIPVALHFWYKFHSSSITEVIQVSALTFNAGTATGAVANNITTNTLVYMEFIGNYNYIGTPSADSAYINIGMYASDSMRTGTYAIIDDLSFGPAGTTEVKELNGSAQLEACSPNPATEVANIIYSLAGNSKVNLTLYDLVGNKVKTLLEDIDQSTGRYKVPAEVRDLPGGIYFYILNVNGQSYTQKLMVTK